MRFVIDEEILLGHECSREIRQLELKMDKKISVLPVLILIFFKEAALNQSKKEVYIVI